MGAFQTGFTLGSRIAADALDRKEREEQRKREDEDRKLRNELTRSQIDAARQEARKKAEIAEITRGIVDTTQGIDRTATNAALDQDFDAALAASDAAVMAENASRQGQRPAANDRAPATPTAASGRSWMPLSVNPNAPPPRRLPDGQIDLGNPGASSMLPSAMPAPWEEITPEQQAQWYRENPRMAAITRGLQYAWLNGTSAGRLQRAVDPVGVGRAVAIADKDVGFFRPDEPRLPKVPPPNPAATPAAAPTPVAQPAAVAPTPPQPVAGPAAGVMPPVRGGSNLANEQALTVRTAVDPLSPEYQQRLLGQTAQLAAAQGDIDRLRAIETERRTKAVDAIAARLMKDFKGTEPQVARVLEQVNLRSGRITMSEPDKNGLRTLTVVRPDGRAAGEMLSKADQAKIFAAVGIMEYDPTRALKMIEEVNKDLAQAVKDENLLTTQLASNANQVAGTSATIDSTRADNARADAAVTREQTEKTTKARASVALYKQNNPKATEAELKAVEAGVLAATPSSVSKDAPATVQLAQWALQAKMPGINNMADALQWANQSRTQSQGEFERDVYTKALAASMGDPAAAQRAVQEARKFFGAAAASGSPAGAPGAAAPATDRQASTGSGRGNDPMTFETAAEAEAAGRAGKIPAGASVVWRSGPRAGTVARWTNEPAPPVQAAPAQAAPAAPAARTLTPSVDLGPPRIPARPVVQSVPASTAPTSTPDSTPQAQAAAPVQMSFTDAAVASVAAAVTVATGRRIVVDPEIKQKITLSADVMESPEQAFQRFLSAVKRAGLTVNFGNSGAVYITKQTTPPTPAAR